MKIIICWELPKCHLAGRWQPSKLKPWLPEVTLIVIKSKVGRFARLRLARCFPRVKQTVRLRLGERVLAEGEWELSRGEHEVWLALDGQLQPGEAALELYLTEPQEVAKVRIVSSPFAEEEGGK